jgi:hypothetical protein
MYLHKVISKIFVGILKVKDENRRVRIRIYIHWSEAQICVSGSVPKCHGSTTLLSRMMNLKVDTWVLINIQG